MLQILAASALPAASKFVGVKLPQDSGNAALAYIGIAAVAFVVIRLLWAPYSIWREGVREVAELKLELTKPQKIEASRMADFRAEAKAELATMVGQMAFLAMRKNANRDGNTLANMVARMVALSGKANAPEAFHAASRKFGHMCFDVLESKSPIPDDVDAPNPDIDPMIVLMTNMQRFLHGEITAEVLALRLPLDIERKKQP